jgi:hypothetical protein
MLISLTKMGLIALLNTLDSILDALKSLKCISRLYGGQGTLSGEL